jgi:hypothetical protein
LEQALPTSGSGDTLAQDINNASALKADYILVYKTDIDNPAYASTLARAASLANAG